MCHFTRMEREKGEKDIRLIGVCVGGWERGASQGGMERDRQREKRGREREKERRSRADKTD